MAWYNTTLSRSRLDSNKGRKIDENPRGFGGAWRSQEAREALDLIPNNELAVLAKYGIKSLGGPVQAGDHFAKLQVVEGSSQENSRCSIKQPS